MEAEGYENVERGHQIQFCKRIIEKQSIGKEEVSAWRWRRAVER